MKTIAMIMSAVILAGAAGAHAEDAPVRKAGEWEVTVNTGAQQMLTRKYCAATDQPATDLPGSNLIAKYCGSKQVTVSGGTIVADMTCKGPKNMTVTIHSTIVQSGPDAFHTETRSHMDGMPAGMPADMTVTGDARRLGPCQPGDAPIP